ncbi:MAG: hypothetical protein PHN56_00690 [Candidatus Nanoarchaeia archaeon]|nr:hypothetical protein [Candidatus Nanoarchaeia archaeon]
MDKETLIENPINNELKSETNDYAPLPEDLITPKKKINLMKIANIFSYITLIFAGLFMLILYILGLLK